jgi:hypothetical protein
MSEEISKKDLDYSAAYYANSKAVQSNHIYDYQSSFEGYQEGFLKGLKYAIDNFNTDL